MIFIVLSIFIVFPPFCGYFSSAATDAELEQHLNLIMGSGTASRDSEKSVMPIAEVSTKDNYILITTSFTDNTMAKEANLDQDIIVQAEDCNPVPTQATSPDSYVRVTADGAFVMSDFPGTDNATGTGAFTIPVAIPDGDYEVMVRLNTGAIVASGGNWGIKLGATTGSVIENGGGDGTEHSYNPSGPNMLPNTWYDSWFASSEGDAAWYGDIWNAVDGGPTPQLPTSVTLSGIGADDLFFEIRDGMSHNSSYTFIDYFKFVPVISGDFDQSELVDFDDLSEMLRKTVKISLASPDNRFLAAKEPVNFFLRHYWVDIKITLGKTKISGEYLYHVTCNLLELSPEKTTPRKNRYLMLEKKLQQNIIRTDRSSLQDAIKAQVSKLTGQFTSVSIGPGHTKKDIHGSTQ